jgi:pimeloyl-ACP methyl ester carboxylesterase
VRRTVPTLIALVLVVLACGRDPMGVELAAAGERQRVDCAGADGPAVVFVHGLGDRTSAASFNAVMTRLGDERRRCRFDRPGAGDSPPPARAGRDAAALDRELAAVVDRADPDAPVVLVGHAFGSYPVLHFAARHPDRVRAVVTLEGMEPRSGLDPYTGAEGLDLAAVQRQTAAALPGPGALGDLPLLVLERHESPPDWRAAQRRLATLSTAGKVVTVPESGHELPTDSPDQVIDAIRTVSAAD